MKIAIIGLGAVGGYVAFRFAEAGFEVHAITKEVIAAAIQCGAHIDFDALYQYRLSVFKSFEKMPTAVTSMKEDFDQKRPLELTGIYANALRIAEQHGAAMPLTTMLYHQLCYLCDTLRA